MEITAVADKETCTWLKLAGVSEVYPINSDNEPHEVLHSLWIREDVTVIIITPEVAKVCHEQIANMMKEKIFPVIIELPIGSKEKDPLKKLLKEAVGIDLDI